MTCYEKTISLRNNAEIKASKAKGMMKTFWTRALIGFDLKLDRMTVEEAEREVRCHL